MPSLFLHCFGSKLSTITMKSTNQQSVLYFLYNFGILPSAPSSFDMFLHILFKSYHAIAKLNTFCSHLLSN